MRRKLYIFMLLCALAAGSLSGCSTSSAADSGTVSAVSDAASSDAGSGAESAQPDSGAESVQSDTNSDTEPATSVTPSAAETPDASAITFEARDMDGNTVTSDIFSQSRLTMVNVWATYCAPCLNEMPDLGELAQEYAPEDFQIIGIVSDVLEGSDEESMDYTARLISQTGAVYPHLLLNESLYYALLTDVMAVPTTFFFDQDGNLLETTVGSKDKASWKEDIDGLLQKQ